MKKVCIFVGALVGGGIERSMLTLAKGLVKNNVHVDIICLRNKVEYDLDTNLYGVHYISSNTTTLSKNKAINFLLYRKLIRKKIDELETGGTFGLFISNMYEVDRLVKSLYLNNVYFYIHVFKTHYFDKQSLFKKILFKSIYNNERLITVSNALKGDLIDRIGVKPKSIETIYNTFDFDLIRKLSKVNINIDDKFILHVGRFTEQKRHDILLKAFSKSNIEHKLVLLGSGFNRESSIVIEIEKLLTTLDLVDRVIIIGYDENSYKYMSKADLFVLASDYEGMPMVLIESLILGTPVVSTDCPTGPSEILIDELSSYLSPVGDVDRLAENIKRCVLNPVDITDKYFIKFNRDLIIGSFIQKLKL
jgi:glycosyltransferase involved in cell wall biosynthesis